MKVLVTGAAGFLGQRVISRLVARQNEVRCLLRPGTDRTALGEVASEPSVEVVYGTLADRQAVARAMEGCEVVYHVAAALVGATSVLFANNVTATRELMRDASRAGVRRVVLVSSLAVYGTHHLRAGDVLDESCPLDSKPQLRDPYTFSKVEQEKAAEEVHREGTMELVIIRPGVIYGPGRPCISARMGLKMGNWLIRMGGRQQLPYVFVENAADAIVSAGTAAGVDGEAFNILDNDVPSARAVLRTYRKHGGKLHVIPIPHWAIARVSRMCEWYHRRSRGQLPAVLTRYKSDAMWKRLCYTTAKAKQRLQWEPAVAFADGLRQTLSPAAPAISR